MVFLICILLLRQTITGSIRTQAENDFGSCSSKVELNIEKNEQNEETIYNLYCKSKKKPFDDSAEFTVDGFSREHILIIKNRCYDRRKKECSFDYCECDPTHNQFTVKLKIALIEIGQTFGCLIRLRDNATGNFLKIYTSNKFNGTDFTPDECNIKVLGTTTSISNTTSNVTIPTVDTGNDVDRNLTIPLLVILLAIALTIILILVFYICRIHRKRHERSKEEKGMQLKFASDDGAELENTKEEDTLLSSQKLKTADDYFIINCDHIILQFYNGIKLQKGFDKKPRILDMCFVKLHNETHLVYIDADNKSIVVRGLSKESELRKETLTHEPNRLAKINNTTVGVIYKKELYILIFDVCKMEHMFTYSITQGGIVECEGSIQGILALSPTELILSDKIHLYRCYLYQQSGIAKVIDFASSLKDKFDTARRLTQVTVSGSDCQNVIFVADENDKKLTSIGQTENLIDDHIGQNRGLQNVRAIGATEQRVYAATSAGVSVFCHDKGYFNKIDDEDYRMIVEYKKHVEHTRGLCIHLDKDFIYIGLSCVIKQDDIVLVFKFKPNDTFK